MRTLRPQHKPPRELTGRTVLLCFIGFFGVVVRRQCA